MKVENAEPVEKHEHLMPGEYRVISRLTGITPQHVMRVLKGDCGITFEKACSIADAAGVTLDEMRRHIEAVVAEKSDTKKRALPAKKATVKNKGKANGSFAALSIVK